MLSSLFEREGQEKDWKAMNHGRILCFYDMELKANIKYKKLEMVANLKHQCTLKKNPKQLQFICMICLQERLLNFSSYYFLFFSLWAPIPANEIPSSKIRFCSHPSPSLDVWWLLNLLWHSLWNKLMSIHTLSSFFLLNSLVLLVAA